MKNVNPFSCESPDIDDDVDKFFVNAKSGNERDAIEELENELTNNEKENLILLYNLRLSRLIYKNINNDLIEAKTYDYDIKTINRLENKLIENKKKHKELLNNLKENRDTYKCICSEFRDYRVYGF